jgi:GTP pyrophosphokinase
MSGTCLDTLLVGVQSYNQAADLEPIRNAHAFVASGLCGGVRSTPEQNLAHACEVAQILVNLRMDGSTIVAGLLHEALMGSTPTTLPELRQRFGEEVAELVDGLTRISRYNAVSSEERQAENFRKMLIAMARDLRVILVRLADRLQIMRTLASESEEQQRQIARETRDIYAPMANRLGISWLKCELEDLAFCFLEPEIFAALATQVEQRTQEKAGYIEDVKQSILAKLRENGIDGEVYGRSKHLWSIHRKMERQGVELDQIYDLIAFRVMVKSLRDCYAVLGIIHAAWKPLPGRFKDYVAMPKANMYQSLHSTVIGPQGEPMEVQIRTEEMHRIAEEGIAAHWKYKEKGVTVADARDDKSFAWLRQMLENQNELTDSKEFMDSVRFELFPGEVFVFTPRGEVCELPRGATPIDFAFSIHSNIGMHCVGAKVNGKLVPLKTVLGNGDLVEIVTSPNQVPSKDWLKHVHTAKARNKIRQWIKNAEREKSIVIGRDLLEKELRKQGAALNRFLGSEELTHVAQDLGFSTVDDLLAGVGYSKVPVGQVSGRLLPPERSKTEGEVIPVSPRQPERKKSASAISIHGVDDILVRFAKCCNPLPGDEVTGFVTRGRGVTVHTVDCPHALQTDPERRIDVEWDLKKKSTRPVKVRVSCYDQKGILTNITGAITNCEANIVSASIMSTPDQRGVNNFELDVQDLAHLNRVINALLKIKGVYKVERMRS